MVSGESADELVLLIEDLRKKRDDDKLTDYQRQLLKWSDNVDRRYAWVVLLAAWLIMGATFGPFREYGLFFQKIVEEGYYTREEAAWPFTTVVTAEAFSGPLVSGLSYYISLRKCMLLGGLLLVLGNGLAAFSSNVVVDTLLLGVVQGIGFGFAFIPMPEVINSYFLKYRSIALGLSLSGGTFAAIMLEPLVKWLLDEYPWRLGYLAMAGVSCIAILSAPLIMPNPQPQPPAPAPASSSSSRNSDTGILSSKSSSSSPKVELARLEDGQVAADDRALTDISPVWSVLRTPGFHLAWYINLIFYWVYSIYVLVLVDYARDRGNTQEEAEFLIQFQSVGEIIGRIVFSALLDISPLSTQQAVVLNFSVMAALLACVTQVSSYASLAAITICITANCVFIHTLLGKLLVEHLGERRVTLGFGMASFICGVLVIPRPQVVGFFRDRLGSYDLLMLSLAAACALSVVLCLVEPVISRHLLRVQNLK